MGLGKPRNDLFYTLWDLFGIIGAAEEKKRSRKYEVESIQKYGGYWKNLKEDESWFAEEWSWIESPQQPLEEYWVNVIQDGVGHVIFPSREVHPCAVLVVPCLGLEEVEHALDIEAAGYRSAGPLTVFRSVVSGQTISEFLNDPANAFDEQESIPRE